MILLPRYESNIRVLIDDTTTAFAVYSHRLGAPVRMGRSFAPARAYCVIYIGLQGAQLEASIN